jgi:hypothetical protein
MTVALSQEASAIPKGRPLQNRKGFDMKLRSALQVIAALAVVSTPMLALAPAEAAVEFTCPSGVICVYPNDGWTGNYGSAPGEITAFGNVAPNSWYTFGSLGYSNPNPGSITNQTTYYCAFVYSKKLSDEAAENPGNRSALDSNYGYILVTGTVNGNCPSAPPPPS